MKRMLAAVLACTAAAALTACSAPEETSNASASAQEQTGSQPASAASSGTSAQPAGDGSILIAYFTVPETDGVDTVSSASRVATDSGVVGNTQYIAQAIQQSVGGDLFAIETVQEYPGTHDELLEFAYNELQDNARPELAAQIENPDDYSVIFLRYPNRNSDLPMPLYTFLESYDFSGKTIIPFVTHGGSGFSRTISTIQELQPGATVVEDGFSVSRNAVADAAQDAMDWAASAIG